MPQIIAVLGATGTQGGSVVRTFLNLSNWTVRAITRNTSSPAAEQLSQLGATVVRANLDDPASLEAAFTGATAIFAVTDFWQFPQDPAVHQAAAAKGITWNEECYRRELQHGTNIIDAAAKIVGQSSSFQRLVISSLNDVKRASKGKYTWAYHFDAKAHYVQYLARKAEEAPESAYKPLFEKTSYVQIGYYLDNWSKNPVLHPAKQPDGSFGWRSVGGDSSAGKQYPIPFVHPPTDTGPFVEALVLRAPPKTTLLGASSLMQFEEYVALWGEINGVKATVQSLSLAELEELFPGGLGRETGESAASAREFGWDGGEGAILPEQGGVDLEALTTVEKYINSTDWSSVLG